MYPGHATPWEVARQRERDADRGIEVSAGHLAHEEDDRHHHQAGCDDRDEARRIAANVAKLPELSRHQN
jgi:hypothetical protein